MVRTASAAAVLIFAAGLGSAAAGQAPEPSPPPPAASPAPAAVAAPAAAPATLPSIGETMRAQAAADAPPPPPPPPPSVAAPSVAVAAAALAPASKAGAQVAFAAPPASAVEAAKAAPVVVQVSAPAPRPALVKAMVVEPAAAPQQQPTPKAPEANAFVAHRVTDAAGAFDAWTEKAARIDGKFVDAKGVSAALTDASAVQTEQLEEGAVAYGALAALQDPVFVQSAHDLAAIGGDHDAAAAVLLKDPAQVMTLPGADEAAAFTAQALSRRALAVTTAGKAVRQAAYSLQASPWARDPIATPEKRLAEAKARSASAIALDGPASGLLMKRLVDLRGGGQSAPGKAAPTPLVTRSLALAAMIVLGEADEAHAAKLTPLLAEPKSSDCLKMAKLNFFQCLSVAGPNYEDAFCVGEHGLGEAGQCLATATGVPVATPVVAPVLVVAVAAPVPPAGVAVPIALLSDSGPERRASREAPPPAPVQAAPTVVAEAAAPPPPPAVDQPAWAREAPPPPSQVAAPQTYAQQDEAPPAAPRYDRGRAYIWDRQTRQAGYVAPPYGGYGYVDPRQAAYGRYAPARPAYNASDDDDAPPAPRPYAYPPRGYADDR